MTIETLPIVTSIGKPEQKIKSLKMSKEKPSTVDATLTSSKGSRIFTGHRALGYVSNHIPLQCRFVHRRRENLIVTCVGRAFHT